MERAVNIGTVKKAASFGIRHLTQLADYHLGKGWTTPDRVSISLTYRCNAHCLMCDLWKTDITEQDEIPAERWIEILEELRSWIGPFSLSLLGGEIFVKKGAFDIIRRSVELGIPATILSNGIIFKSPKNLQRFVDTGIQSVAFSLDGMQPSVHDRFRGRDGLHETVVEAIGALKRINPRMSITTTCIIMKDTISELPEYVRWTKDLGVDLVQFQPIAPNFGAEADVLEWMRTSDAFIRDLDELDRVMDALIAMKAEDDRIVNSVENLEKVKEYFRDPAHAQVKKDKCMLGQTNLNIDQFGNMSFCYKFENTFGNVNDGPIRTTWRNASAAKYRKAIKACTLPCMSLCYRTFTLREKILLFFKYVRLGRL